VCQALEPHGLKVVQLQHAKPKHRGWTLHFAKLHQCAHSNVQFRRGIFESPPGFRSLLQMRIVLHAAILKCAAQWCAVQLGWPARLASVPCWPKLRPCRARFQCGLPDHQAHFGADLADLARAGLGFDLRGVPARLNGFQVERMQARWERHLLPWWPYRPCGLEEILNYPACAFRSLQDVQQYCEQPFPEPENQVYLQAWVGSAPIGSSDGSWSPSAH